MILRRLAALLLALALLAGWQESLQHPLEHVDAQGGFVHRGGEHDDSEPRCDALAAMASAVAGGAPLPQPDPPAAQPLPRREHAAPACAPRLAYRSQAPPSFL